MRQFLVLAEVPLTSRPETDDAGMIVIATETARQAEKAIEHLADLAAIATSSRRTITSAVPCAGFTGVTSQDREWLASCAGLLQPPRHLQLVPVSLPITDPAILALTDRRDGAQLLAEALADTHYAGRFRELARFFERAFRLQPAALVTPLASFLSYYDKLRYTRDEVERWHALRNRATHADRTGQAYALARDVRPVVVRVELAAYDVLSTMMFPAAVAVVDAELGIVQRLTFYIGGKPVQRYELRDITASDQEFRADLPPGLTVTEETGPLGGLGAGRLTPPPNLPLAIATAIGRHAAAEAGKAARNLLNHLQGRQPEDGE
jgi:hypothetical protein